MSDSAKTILKTVLPWILVVILSCILIHATLSPKVDTKVVDNYIQQYKDEIEAKENEIAKLKKEMNEKQTQIREKTYHEVKKMSTDDVANSIVDELRLFDSSSEYSSK